MANAQGKISTINNPDISVSSINLYPMTLDNTNKDFKNWPLVADNIRLGEIFSVFNLSKNEVITLDFCCGGSGEVMSVVVRKINSMDSKKVKNQSYIKKFITNNGLKLGDNISDVIKIHGKKYNEYLEGDVKIIKYYNQYDNIIFRGVDLQEYYEYFYFKKNKLIKMEFGYVPP